MAEPGTKDFQAIYEEIFRDVHNTTDTTVNVFPDLAEIKKMFNDEYRKFVTSKEWPFARKERTITLVDGTADYALPEDVQKIGPIMREETKPARIEFVPRERFERAFPKGLGDAPVQMPVMWTELDRDTDNSLRIRFRGTPGPNEDTLVVRFIAYINPADLVGDTDIMIVPVALQDIPIMRTKARIFKLLDTTDNQQVELADAEKLEKEAWRGIQNQPGYVEEMLDYFNETDYSRRTDLDYRLFNG